MSRPHDAGVQAGADGSNIGTPLWERREEEKGAFGVAGFVTNRGPYLVRSGCPQRKYSGSIEAEPKSFVGHLNQRAGGPRGPCCPSHGPLPSGLKHISHTSTGNRPRRPACGSFTRVDGFFEQRRRRRAARGLCVGFLRSRRKDQMGNLPMDH